MNNETLADIYQNETHPHLYFQRQRETRRRQIEEIVLGVLGLAFIAFSFTLVQIAYGIW